MTPRLAAIYRHPIKAIGVESLDQATLSPGAALPMDRHWAIAHAAARFAGDPEGWENKRSFLRGVAAAPLMAVTAALTEDGAVRLSHPDRPELTAAPDTEDGAAALLDWVGPLWPAGRPAPDRVVRTRSGAPLTDDKVPYLAVHTRASLAALSDAVGQPLSPQRFRGNLWLDGLPALVEREWVGREIQIGAVRLHVDAPIGRCEAISGNPQTGVRDLDLFGRLEEVWGHTEFGVFARVIQGGWIAVGDPVAA